jgi:hypothetical protein
MFAAVGDAAVFAIRGAELAPTGDSLCKVRKIVEEHLSPGELCFAVCRKYEWTAKMFHVKHFRRPFVGKFCTVDKSGLRETPVVEAERALALWVLSGW